jgi:NADPH:quinone reductase-like Zn-dependent oxidoreductase
LESSSSLSSTANDANPENGAFARYIAVKEDIQMHIPDSVSFEAAATVGVGVGTTGYALYKVLGLPMPDPTVGNRSSKVDEEEAVLIYGGSTATGSLAIQLAKLYASCGLLLTMIKN